MDDIWIISWFNHTAFDANPIWKSPNIATTKVQQVVTLGRGEETTGRPNNGITLMRYYMC